MKIDWIDDKVAASGGIDDYNELVRQGIDIVVNTRYECHDDLIELGKLCITYIWLPIVDNYPPVSGHMRAIIQLVKNNPDRKILIHCTYGMGRSVSLAMMYLINKYQWTLEQTYEHMKKCRLEMLPTTQQMEKLESYYNRIRKGE